MFNHFQGVVMLPAEFANVLDAQELRTQFAEWLSSDEGKPLARCDGSAQSRCHRGGSFLGALER